MSLPEAPRLASSVRPNGVRIRQATASGEPCWAMFRTRDRTDFPSAPSRARAISWRARGSLLSSNVGRARSVRASRRRPSASSLRADPLREALDGFERPATVISESPDEASSQAIRAVLR